MSRNTNSLAVRGQDGFALVIALSLMAFVLLLMLSLSTLIQVDQKSASITISQLQSRENARLGAMVAIGALQKYAGQDQRVTAPATLSEPVETLNYFRSRARNAEGVVGGTWATFLDEAGQANFEDDLDSYWTTRNPRWVGIWNSELKDGTSGDFKRQQLPIWLVSGNEQFDFNVDDPEYPADYVTPAEILGDPSTDSSVVYVVGEGSSVQLSGSTGIDGVTPLDSIDGVDGRVKVKKVELSAGSDNAGGHFAYWVGDESQKANLRLIDPYFDAAIESSDYNNRVLAPQRSGVEQISGYKSVFGDTGHDINDEKLQRLLSLEEASAFDQDLNDPTRQNFHNVTVSSKGLFTDTARGGLRKDLTRYVEDGSGLSDSDPIADRSDYTGDKRFGSGAGFPSSATNIPKWGAIRDWYQNEASSGGAGAVAVSADMAPSVTMVRLFVGFSRDGGRVRMHLMPTITLWNPYDVDLQSASYRLKLKFKPEFIDFRVATSGLADPNTSSTDDGFVLDGYLVHPLAYIPDVVGGALVPRSGSSDLKYTWEPYSDDLTLDLNFSAAFGAGENLVFSVLNDQEVENPYAKEAALAGSSLNLDLANGFDADFPASVYFDMFELVNPPNAGDTVRYYANVNGSTSKSDNTYQLEMEANGVQVFESLAFGDINLGYVAANARTGNRDPLRGVDLPSTEWRILPDGVNTFSSLISGSADTNSPTQPAFCIAMNYIEPFTMVSYRMDSMIALSGYYRAFASYNLAANQLNVHPRVDLVRGMFAQNNGDGFDRFSFVKSTGAVRVNGNYNDGLPWDDNIAESPGSDTYGFSLVSPRFNVGGVGEYESLSKMAIRQAKRPKSELVSIGQLQQVNLSPFFWNPSFPVGNSEASQYVDRDSISGIKRNVFYKNSSAPVPNSVDNDVLDVSYLLNDALWDRYFFSTLTNDYDLDLADPSPLANSRIKITKSAGLTDSDLLNFDSAAANLYNEGAFNVNSTSVEAWTALISAFRDLQIASADGGTNPNDTVPVSRSLQPLTDPVNYAFDSSVAADYGAVSSNRNYYKVLAGSRYMDDTMVEALAKRIVDEVRLRGPFLSLADFVNRRLVAPDDSTAAWENAREQDSGLDAWKLGFMETTYDPIVGLNGINGALQRAINVSGINGGVNYSQTIPSENLDRVYGVRNDSTETTTDGSTRFMQYAASRYYLDTEHLTGSPVGEGGQLMSHAPGFVTQGDLLSMIGSALTVRGDTFVIRSYGDSENPVSGEVDSKVWLETLVQRLPEPVVDTNGDMEPDDAFGRKFKIVSMRWLSEADI